MQDTRVTLDTGPVQLPFPGRGAKKVVRVSKACFFVMLLLISIVAGLPVWNAQALSQEASQEASFDESASQASQAPRNVGSDPVPDLSLPKTVLSSVEGLIGAGGVVQTSPDNITLYNSAVRMRLLGGLLPHDELLGADKKRVSSHSFWSVQAEVESGLWVPLLPLSSGFTPLGTNTSGTFIVRTMQVGTAQHSGSFRIVYKASSAGLLKWDLDFTSDTSGQYRLVYTWLNITRTHQLLADSKQFLVSYAGDGYTLRWNDVPAGFTTITTLTSDQFSLFVNLGAMAAGARVIIDPSLVGSNVSNDATASSFQRKVFHDSKANNYWAFYYDGFSLRYKYSPDTGATWYFPTDTNGNMPAGWPTTSRSDMSIYVNGPTVVAATGESKTEYWNCYPYTGCGGGPISVSLRYSVGSILGPKITWGTVSVADTLQASCDDDWGTSCTLNIGIRSVGVAISSNGYTGFSYNWFYGEPGTALSQLRVKYQTQLLTTLASTGNNLNNERSVVFPSNSQAQMRVVYQAHSLLGTTVDLRSIWLDGTSTGTVETVENRVLEGAHFSAASDADYNIHLAYRGGSGNVTYVTRSASTGSWTYYKNILSGSMPYPTITADHSTGDVYAFAVNNTSIVMRRRRRSSAGNWSDTSIAYPVTQRVNPAHLTSNFASSSSTNSSKLLLMWTEGSSPYNATFASIPIQTVWSPYASPTSPWDGNGLAPYGQYFANLGESVSPSTGMLTVRQTDLSLPGRGLSLEITRVYTEPYSFLSTGPFNYESYPWAPIGNGWQLNFPWLSNLGTPSYVHLWDGQGYRIPSSFWTGSTAVFENHQGEHFRLLRNSTGMFLYVKTGIAYKFDTSYRLTKILDPIGNNITFSYTNNKISSITDTVGRVFQFCYTANLLTTVYQTSGTCSSPGTVRSIVYNYASGSLSSVTDPGGRLTYYSYNATGNTGIAPWLLSRIRYATQWYSNYTYVGALMGTQTTSYRVSKQLVSSMSIPIRRFDYTYWPLSGRDTITNSTVVSYDGNTGSLKLAGYTRYSYSFAGMTMNVSDADNKLVRGLQQRFGVNGEVPREIVLVTDGSGGLGSYTNYYQYDLWGNQIYSRRVINPSANWYHESFNAYYNNGLPPGFYAFQDTFSQNQGSATDNPWSTRKGYWMVRNGSYNGTETSGHQEDMLAWTDIGKADISIQARVYVARQINTTANWPRVGLFGHYNNTASKAYKWGLVLVNTGSGTYLKLLDEWNVWLASTTCNLPTATWYTFNMTIRGYQASGWTSTSSQTCPISGTFSASSPAASFKGFGLYAGGYSALFDNVTIATVTPYITITGFSNSFVSNGAPGSNIHGALAGTAELMNGTGTTPAEAYYGYNAWGGLGQTKQRYDLTPGPVQWLTTSRTYDGYGNLARLTDSRGNFTDFSYSSSYNFAYMTTQTHTLVPGGTQLVTQYSYNFTIGNVLSVTDPKGNVTSYQNDSLGRVKRIDYPLTAYAQYTYNDAANYVDIMNENGWKTRLIYDGLARQTIEDRFLGILSYSNETFAYDWQNNVVRRTDPLGNTARYRYDTLGRMVNATQANGKSILQTYNDLASWAQTADEDGKYRCTVLDRFGRLVSVVEKAAVGCQPGVVTNYYHNEVGGLTKVTNALAKSTTYTYDNLGRLIGTTFADNTTESYAYDNNGNLVRKVDRKSVKTLYGYDSLNRVKTITYCGTAITSRSYAYDKNGSTLTLQNENATITYTYDARGRPLSEKYEVNLAIRSVVDLGCFGPGGTSTVSGGLSKTYTVKYAYNGEVLETVEYPTLSITNIIVKFTYDSLGRILNVTRSGTSTYYARSFTYFANDRPKGLQFGNGLIGNYTYDSLARPASIALKNGGNTILSLSYTYNNTATIATVTGQVNGASVNEQYRYDPMQRLTNTTVASQGTTTTLWYEYDNVGNRLRQKANGAWTTYSYNQTNNRLNSYSAPGLNLAYTYNNDGTLKTRTITNNSTVWAYTWNVAGHLLKATRGGANQGLYAYDGLGRKVEAIESNTNYYAYAGTETLFTNISGLYSIDYLYAGSLRIATVDSSSGSYTTVKYFHVDHLGSTRLVTSATASILFADGYQPFGRDNGTPTGSETYKFTGKPYSQTTGLYYSFQRWYDPEIGRFISQDPYAGHLSNPQSLNRYTYVENTPTVFTDPTGLDKGLNTDKFGSNCGGTCAGDAYIAYAAIIIDVVGLGIVACVFVCPAIAAYLGIGGAEAAAGASGTSAFACAEECAPVVDVLVVDTAGVGTQELVNTASFFESVEAGTSLTLTNLVDTSVFWVTTESSNYWSVTRQGSRILDPLETMIYHFDRHVPADFDISAGEYTRDALSLRNLLWDTGRAVPFRSFGGTAWKISTEWGPGGIYTLAGKIITFWYGAD